ncbi:MAG: SPFH domain-containing protein [Solirubrobacterales bacterium]|nr:SPFH domain-containing protein [Solirubrobacterales bacterium]MBV9799284.1 SPFH domain-containing protein [Solirubrobacterales bacterium]
MSVISDTDAVGEAAGQSPSSARRAHEQRSARVIRGLSAVGGVVAGIALGVALITVGTTSHTTPLKIVGVVLLVLAAALAGGLFVVPPNESRVLILFGRYVGTVAEAGWWWCNPFTKRERVSLRVRNFQSERIKVNDASGNPIEIAAVVVWHIIDTARAVFDVADYEQFVVVQSETSLRQLASQYAYDDYKQDSISLRANADEVRESLQAELQARLRVAGIEILETRLTHLAYAPEIAEVMLRRQQAEAILAARKTMVQGAVTLVQMAVSQLADSDLIELDPERKAAMVSNLMVVLSGDHSPTPVLNTGSLYT